MRGAGVGLLGGSAMSPSPAPRPLALLLAGLALAAAVAVAPLGQGLAVPPAAAADAHVHISGFAYDPAVVVVLVGESITWDNHDVVAHTVTADDFSFNSGNMGNGDAYTRTFDAPGTIPYHCDLHPSMAGDIVVSDPNALPDLVVTELSAADSLPGLGKNVNVTVRNFGQAAAGASSASVGYVYHGTERAIGALAVPILGPGATFTGTVPWATVAKVGDFEVRALADAGGDVDEADEGNNLRTATVSVLVPGVPGLDLLEPV